SILSQNVASLEAAQELEITLRQLRFHSFLVRFDPTEERRDLVEKDHVAFEQVLEKVRSVASKPAELALVQKIDEGYHRYHAELAEGVVSSASRPLDLAKWADAHPIRHLVAPCHELLKLNKDKMDETARESAQVSGHAQVAMLLAGLLGPV